MVKLVSTRQVDFKDIDAPKILYKFRDWDNELHRTIITKRQVYFAKPTSFKDTFDCKIPIRYDLLKARDIYNFYLNDSIEKHLGWSRQKHRAFAREWTKKSPIRDREYIQNAMIKEFNEFNERYGILSLTSELLNSEMWKEYSNNYKGFAIGFDPLIIFQFFGGGGQVLYYDELPVIYPRPIHNFETQSFLQIYSKLRKWEFEKEYRTQILSPHPLTNDERKIFLPPNAFKEIIIGPLMDAGVQLELRNSLPEELKELTIRQLKLLDNRVVM